MTPVATILRAARAQIADPARWTREAIARDQYGQYIGGATDPRAVCWCAIGSVHWAAWTLTVPGQRALMVERVLGVLRRGLPPNEDLADYNDTTSHADVLALFDRAIAAAESEAPHA